MKSEINTPLFEELAKVKKDRNDNSMKIGDFLLDKFKLYSLCKFDCNDKYFYIKFLSLDEEKSAKIPELIDIINDIETLSKEKYIKLKEGANQLSFGEWIMAQPYVTSKPCPGLPPDIKDEDLKMWKIINSHYEIVAK